MRAGQRFFVVSRRCPRLLVVSGGERGRGGQQAQLAASSGSGLPRHLHGSAEPRHGKLHAAAAAAAAARLLDVSGILNISCLFILKV